AEVSTEFAPQSEKTAKLKWNRIQVDKNCNRTDEDFAPGKYDLIVKLDDRASEPTTFELEKDAATKAKEKKAKEKKDDESGDEDSSEDGSSSEDQSQEQSSDDGQN